MQDKPESKEIKTTRHTIKTIAALIILFVGVWAIGHFVTAGGNLVSQARRITAIMKLIQDDYVDAPDLSRLGEGAIEGMLKRLDPHSAYIPVKRQKEISERDVGEFEGIGISFVIQNELITVISPIIGTPAERMGIRSGDRIIEIEGVSALGITNEEVFKKLRGPKGTTVNVKIAREGAAEPLDFAIVRAKIPIYSVWASFMLDDSTGYIGLSQFMATSTKELDSALDKLEAQGMTRLIFDLRGNSGGRLSQAVSITDRFIPGNHTIVSRRGRKSDNDTYFTSSDSVTHMGFSLITLINNGSASASEIVAGAIQDLDRGLIVGTNSFGKGLVQFPYQLRDGSVIRLSTAHWYTPAGRLVQRPYDKGRGEYYAVAYRDPDSLAVGEEREVFKTKGGRYVYSSSGIAPDVIVEPGTYTVGTARMIAGRILFAFAQQYVTENGLTDNIDFSDFQNNFDFTAKELDGLIELSNEKEIAVTAQIIEKDFDFLNRQIKAEIATLVWNEREKYFIIRTAGDNVIQKALEVFDQAREVASVWQ